MRLSLSAAILALVIPCDGAFRAAPVNYRTYNSLTIQNSSPSTLLYAVDPNKEQISVEDVTAEVEDALRAAEQSLNKVNGQQQQVNIPVQTPKQPTRPSSPPQEENAALKFMQGFASKVGKFMANAATGAATKVATEVQAMPGKLANAASNAAKRQADNMVAGIQSIPGNIQNAAQRKAEETVNGIKAIPGKVQSAAAKKADETIKGIEAIPSKIADAALDAADKLAEEAAATPGRIADSASKTFTRAVDEVTALPRKQIKKLEAMLDKDKTHEPQPPRLPPPTTPLAKVEPPKKPEPPKVPPRAPSAPRSVSPKKEAPKIELPKIEAPKINLSNFELPKIDAPKMELPKIEPSAFSLPKVAEATTKKSATPAKKSDDNFIFSEVSLKNLLNQDSASRSTSTDTKEADAKRKRDEADQRRKQQEAAARAREAEAKRRDDLDKKRREDEARRNAADAKRQAEAESRRQAELAKKQQAAEAAKARLESQRQSDMERKQQDARNRQAAEERQRQEAAAKRQAELKKKQEQAAAQKAAVDKARVKREAANKAAQLKKQEQADARKSSAVKAEQQRLEAQRNKEQQAQITPVMNIFSSPSLRVAPSQKKPSPRLTKAPAGVSTIVRWKLRRDGGISGLVYGNSNFDDGDRIETTKIAKGDIENGCVVETGSGSKYFLSDTTPGGVTNKQNAMKDLFSALPGATITLTRQTRDKDAKTALETVEQAKPRSTFSLFGNTAKIESSSAPFSPSPASAKRSTGFERRPVRTAPRGVPSISKWKENRDGSITGLISGSPNFRDGERITTSPIASGRIAAEETVRTGSGSRYFLS
ncbi:hypothetical protein MPSEU_000735000 [Mayamaea pseudoterrestris]|nr:hypothetical protein MPSEU_000735000 [Mayamaea pseudoterrestris]